MLRNHDLVRNQTIMHTYLQILSPLAQAVKNGHTEIVETLLARPDIDITESVSYCYFLCFHLFTT